MTINIPDEIIREFLSGVTAIIAVIAVGAFISFILRGIAKKFSFTRVALVIALAPLSLINFLGNSGSTALLLYAMITTLFGVIVDGINYLILPRENPQNRPNPADQEEETAESNPSAIVWEKAE